MVTAAVQAQVPKAGTIPELLLKATGHGGAKRGLLAKVSYIQRGLGTAAPHRRLPRLICRDRMRDYL
jgi:hypothetical protein